MGLTKKYIKKVLILFLIIMLLTSTAIFAAATPEQITERIKDADVVLCNKSPMTAENLRGAKNLKYIGLFATGYNNVDLEYTKKHNITVCNAGSYSTEAVAQHTFAMILHNYNKISEYNEFVRNK